MKYVIVHYAVIEILYCVRFFFIERVFHFAVQYFHNWTGNRSASFTLPYYNLQMI